MQIPHGLFPIIDEINELNKKECKYECKIFDSITKTILTTV